MTVSKTFVNEVIRKHNYEIQILRKKIKNGKPKGVPRNLVWGADLTGKKDSLGNLITTFHQLLHHSALRSV